MFRTLSLGDSISAALRKLLQGGRRGSQATYKFATKGAGSLIIKDLVSRNLTVYVWEDASLWARWIHSFHMHLSYLGPILFSCSPGSLHSPSSSAITAGVGSIHWIAVWGALIPIWRPEITDGCGISCLLIWQELFSFHISSLPVCPLSFLLSGPSPCASTLALRPSVFSRVQVSFKNSQIAGEGSLDNPNGFLS